MSPEYYVSRTLHNVYFVACDDLDVNIDPTVWWDDLKLSFKALAIQHSTYLAKEKNRMYSALTAQYILAEKLGNLENMQIRHCSISFVIYLSTTGWMHLVNNHNLER